MTARTDENIYSVRQINAYIQNMVAQDFMLRHIRVGGEVSNCKYHSSGHIYFTLKDNSGVLSAVMFAGDRARGLTFPMKAGDQVVVTGSIRVYERAGTYQLYAERIEPQGTGALYQKYEALKKELEEMGMFDPSYKQPIPAYARRIGVVTAPTGAAVRDIQTVAHRRNPYVQLILYPARVQGEGAAETIISGIRALTAHDVDVIIVGRGGGSIEDLWAFNEESVARAIFDCPVPIISAVGHETDFTIADFVADYRAPTPSAAAELAVFDIRQTLQQLESIRYTLNQHMGNHMEQVENRIQRYRLELRQRSPQVRLANQRHHAADVEERLDGWIRQLLADSRRQTVDTEERLHGRITQLLSENRHRLQLIAVGLEAASPLKKLESGYAYMARPDGTRIRGVADVHTGDRIRAHLKDGSLTATVDEIQQKE